MIEMWPVLWLLVAGEVQQYIFKEPRPDFASCIVTIAALALNDPTIIDGFCVNAEERAKLLAGDSI